MKVEICCPRCGRGHLVNPEKAASVVTCQGCGATLPVRGLASVAGAPPATAPAPRPAARAETIPAATHPPVRPAPAPVAASPRSSAIEEIQCPGCGLHFSPRTSRAPAESGRRRRVLVVEDMPFFQESMREALSERYDLLFASTVAGAKRALEVEPLDLLLLDLTLENGEDGLAVLRSLSRKPCPVVILSSAEDETYGDRWQSLRALGADDVVVKGMNAGDALARKVAEILGGGPEQETSPG